MAKIKKKNFSDKVRNRITLRKEKKPNPFEFKINRQKHDIIGRIKRHSGQVGKPGQARSKANKRRTQTLLVELKQSGKANIFKDQRIGEKDPNLSADDRVIKKFAFERKVQSQRRVKLGEEMGEDEELTHYGQSLAEIEKFEPQDDSDPDEDGNISGKMVAEEHFGGFLTQKNTGLEKKSWKEKMEELITQTRKEKHQRQTEKDDLVRQTQEVDEEWKNIHSLLFTKKSGKADQKDDSIKPDDYDIAVRKLQFEIKGRPSDRLKTEEELAKEEAERLQKLELDRKRRMMGEINPREETSKHISADSLEDSYGPGEQKKTFQVMFKDGKLLQEPDEVSKHSASDDGSDVNSDQERDESFDEGEEDEDDSALDEDDDSDDQEEEEEAEKIMDGLLKRKTCDKQIMKKSILKKTQASVDPAEQKKIADAAREELPYTFEAPSDYESLVGMLSVRTVEQQVVIVERLCTCHHPSLAEGNKQKLELIFSLLLQYLLECMVQEDPPLLLIDSLTPILHRLLRFNPEVNSNVVLQLLMDRHEEFQQICQRRGGRGKYMGLDSLLLLKLIHVLFPTSDFRHPLVTPAFYFISDMLSQCPVQNERDVAAGLYLCALCLEYVSLSMRFVPEVITFLHGILFLAADKNPKELERVFSPFRPVGSNIDLLKVNNKDIREVHPTLSLLKTLAGGIERQELDTDEFRLSSISVCVCLLQEFANMYSKLPGASELLAPVQCMLGKLPAKHYPEFLQKQLKELDAFLKSIATTKLKPLTLEKKKPQPLKLFEPRVEEVFEGKKKRKGNREFNERQRLQHKLKREHKGALREIRKDSRFLAKQHLQETIEKDSERKRKLAKLHGDLSTQEGEFKALKRLKNKS